jgi:hypothetical protein
MPSGTLLIAPGSPATTSARRWRRCGPIDRTQAPTATSDARHVMGRHPVQERVLLQG